MPAPLSLAAIEKRSSKAPNDPKKVKLQISSSAEILQTKKLALENQIAHLNLKPNSKGLIHIREFSSLTWNVIWTFFYGIMIPPLGLLLQCVISPSYEVTFDVKHKKVYYKAGTFFFAFCNRSNYGNEVCSFEEIGTVVLGYRSTPMSQGEFEAITCYYPILVFKSGKKFNIFNFEKTSTVGTFVRFGDGTMHRDEQYIESVCVALQRLIFDDSSIMSVERINIAGVSMEPKEEEQLRDNLQPLGVDSRRRDRLKREQQLSHHQISDYH